MKPVAGQRFRPPLYKGALVKKWLSGGLRADAGGEFGQAGKNSRQSLPGNPPHPLNRRRYSR